MLKRIVWAILASAFTALGVGLTAGPALVIARGGKSTVLVALPLGVAFIVIGILWFTMLPYRASTSSDALELGFVCAAKRIPWEDVQSYRTLALAVSLTAGEAGVWTLLRYRDRTGQGTHLRTAIVCLAGTGPGFGSREDYMTPLDWHLPTRKAKSRER
jgi:hypothetical protein